MVKSRRRASLLGEESREGVTNRERRSLSTFSSIFTNEAADFDLESEDSHCGYTCTFMHVGICCYCVKKAAVCLNEIRKDGRSTCVRYVVAVEHSIKTRVQILKRYRPEYQCHCIPLRGA